MHWLHLFGLPPNNRSDLAGDKGGGGGEACGGEMGGALWFQLFTSLNNQTTGLIWLVTRGGVGGRRGGGGPGRRQSVGGVGRGTKKQCGSNPLKT